MMEAALSTVLVALTAIPRPQVATEPVGDLEARIQSLYPALAASTVALRAQDGETYLGSGVVVQSDGLVLTHGHHHQAPGAPVIVTFSDGRKSPGRYLGINEFFDQSLIRLDGDGPWPAARIGSPSALKPGEPCILLGYPRVYFREGRPPLLRIGKALGVSEQHVFTSSRTLGGDSGGPLFNLAGELLGTHQLQQHSERGSGQVRIDIYLMLREQLLSGEHVVSGEMGSQLTTPALLEAARRVSSSVVSILAGGKLVGLGLVVDPHGLIVTKASELALPLSCRLADGRALEAAILAKDVQQDLALLSVEAVDLRVAEWQEASPRIGQILGVVSTDPRPSTPAVVSSPVLDVPAETGELAVSVDHVEGGELGVVITEIWDGKTKTAAVLRPGDIITHVRDRPTPDPATFFKARQFAGDPLGIVGNSVGLTVIREGRTIEVEAPIESRSNIMIEEYLGRRTGFPAVFAHDGKVLRRQLGGPVVNASGQVVGIDIATEPDGITYAIPAAIVRMTIARLRAR
jgi:serine protease Do